MTSAWQRFWFKPIDGRQLAALRIVFGALSVSYLLALLPYTESQFSSAGWQGSIRQLALLNGGSWSLFFFDAGQYANVSAYAIVVAGVVSSLLLTFGWHSRLMAVLTWLVWVSLWNRNPLVLDGDDAVLKVMCFYLMLSPCGQCWSWDCYRQSMQSTAPIWSLRLVQFQIALIYFVSGWVKFFSPEWTDGTVLQYVLIHPHYSRWDSWMLIHPPALKPFFLGLAQFIRVWELLFPILLLNRHSRRFSIIIGICFHLGLLLTMNLRGFAIIMLGLYLALVPNHCFANFECRLQRLWRSWKTGATRNKRLRQPPN